MKRGFSLIAAALLVCATAIPSIRKARTTSGKEPVGVPFHSTTTTPPDLPFPYTDTKKYLQWVTNSNGDLKAVEAAEAAKSEPPRGLLTAPYWTMYVTNEGNLRGLYTQAEQGMRDIYTAYYDLFQDILTLQDKAFTVAGDKLTWKLQTKVADDKAVAAAVATLETTAAALHKIAHENLKDANRVDKLPGKLWEKPVFFARDFFGNYPEPAAADEKNGPLVFGKALWDFTVAIGPTVRALDALAAAKKKETSGMATAKVTQDKNAALNAIADAATADSTFLQAIRKRICKQIDAELCVDVTTTLDKSSTFVNVARTEMMWRYIQVRRADLPRKKGEPLLDALKANGPTLPIVVDQAALAKEIVTWARSQMPK